VLRPECLQWLNDVEQRLPSIVLEARDAEGHDLTAVKVTIDGALVADKLDGRAIDLDPGEHVLRLQADGKKGAEQKILLVEGEKRRRISARLEASAASVPIVPQPEPQPRQEPEPPKPEGETHTRVGWPVIALGAIGALGLGGFAFFGLSGSSKQSDLDSGCKPACEPSKVDDVRRTYLFADISLAVGVAAIGAAIVYFVTQSSSTPKRAAVR
jgi:hypothetical protein